MGFKEAIFRGTFSVGIFPLPPISFRILTSLFKNLETTFLSNKFSSFECGN